MRRLPEAPVPSIVAVALAAGLAGCGEDFDPFNRLTSLRVLAIKAEPAQPRPGRDHHAVGAGLHAAGAMGDAGPAPVTYQW